MEEDIEIYCMSDLCVSSKEFERDYLESLLSIEGFDQDEESLLLAFNSESVELFCVMRDEDVIGFASVQLMEDSANIDDIIVDASEIGKGIGKGLMQFVCNHCATEQEVKVITLEVRNDNVRAINFYHDFGFRINGIEANYYGVYIHALRMKLVLG